MSGPEPRANAILRGHETAEAMLANAIRSGRVHHAWLITGPEGVGKATLAYRFARRLLSPRPPEDTLALDPMDPVFRRIAAGAHADLRTVERGTNPQTKRLRSEIVVDDARSAVEFLRLTPAEGGWRVVVIDRADTLNRNAANALLKILEEPPVRSVLLLVCAAPGRVPSTIRSRCRRLRLSPLSDAVMAELLVRYLPERSDTERARLVALAEGSVGRALLLAQEEGIALAALADQVLGALPELPPTLGHEIADRLGRSDAAFSTFMDLLRAALSAAVRDAARGRAEPHEARIAALRPLAAWGDVWHALTGLQDETEQFALDKRQAILAALAMLSGPVQSLQ
jgi:DNA polymerase III subunit delta'